VSSNLTTREVGQLYRQPEWLIRRLVDEILPPFEKFGHKRLIPRQRLPEIQAALADYTVRRIRRREASDAR
jgi:hypothetical protein